VGLRGSLGRRPPKIVLDAPVGIGNNFARAFDARLVEAATASWEFRGRAAPGRDRGPSSSAGRAPLLGQRSSLAFLQCGELDRVVGRLGQRVQLAVPATRRSAGELASLGVAQVMCGRRRWCRPTGPRRILRHVPPSSVRSDAQPGTPSCHRSPFDLSLAPCVSRAVARDRPRTPPCASSRPATVVATGAQADFGGVPLLLLGL
jgi:hypothetical protein